MPSAINALSMAETCLASKPTTLFTLKAQLTTKPTAKLPNLPIISYFPSRVSLRSKSFSRIVPLVAETSEQSGLEGEEEEEEEIEETTKWENDNSASTGGDGEGYFPEPPEEAKLYVGNLPFDVDSERLATLFGEAGVVEIAEVIYNRETDQSRGFGFVTMSTVEEAEKAVEMFHRYDLDGRLLAVNKAAPRGSRPERRESTESSFRIYVGNLAWQVDDGRLEQVFSEHGKVVDAKVIRDRETGRSKGFGFVSMTSEAEQNDAIAALDGQSLDGRAIRVNVAEQRPRRNSFSSF